MIKTLFFCGIFLISSGLSAQCRLKTEQQPQGQEAVTYCPSGCGCKAPCQCGCMEGKPCTCKR